MMLVAKEFGVSPPGAVAPRRRAPPARVSAGGGGSPVGELWLRTRGAGASAAEPGSHESDMDLALLVSDFLEGGSGDSRGSSDSESGLSDLAHLADKISSGAEINAELWKALTEQRAELRAARETNRQNEVIMLHMSAELEKAKEESSAGDINVIRRENQDLFKQLEEVKELAAKNQKAFEESAQQEQNRLTVELDSAKRALAAAESKNAENAKVMAELETQLSGRLEEIAAVDNQVLVPCGLGDGLTAENRLSRLQECGELIGKVFQAGLNVISKIFPAFRDTVKTVAELEPQLGGLDIELEDRLRSAARGGAKYALGMVMAWHPEMRIHRVTRSMPECDEDGAPLNEQAIFKSVRGYATRVAKHVDLTVYYQEVPVPPRPADASSDEEEATKGEQASTAAAQDEEA